MRRTTLPVALIALSSLLTAAAATTAASLGVWRDTGSAFDTTSDLGFDVSKVPHTPTDAQAFLLELPRDWQLTVVSACTHFVAEPATVHSPETRTFCRNLLRA